MKRVLIVDDAIDLGRLFQDALKTAHPGMPITVVPSAEEALLESFRLTIDLLVTDLRLPGMSGIELVRKIRVRQPQVKILMITGITLDARAQKQLEEIHVDFFRRKPLGIGEFLDISDELLGFRVAAPPEPVKPVSEPAPAVTLSRDDELRQSLEAALPGEPVTPQEKRQTGMLKQPGAQETGQTGLSARLSYLRSSLGAMAVLLLDESGHVVAEAGDLPEAGMLENLVAPLSAALSAAARVSYQLGQHTSEVVQAFRGQLVDLVVAPIGQYTLLVAQRHGPSMLRLALSFEETLNAQPDLVQALESLGLRVQKVAEVAAVESVLVETVGQETAIPAPDAQPLEALLQQEPGLEQLQALFEKKSSGEIKLSDIDSFWDAAVSSEKSENTAPGMLNYDQAQKLGLLPGENK